MDMTAMQDALYDHFFGRGLDGPVLEANVKMAVVYLSAARFGDKCGEITKFTGYAPSYIWDRVEMLKKNGQLLNSTVSRKALLTCIPGGEAIIDAWLGITKVAESKPQPKAPPKIATPVVAVSTSPKPVAKPATSPTPAPGKSPGKNKAATIRAVMEEFTEQGKSFTWQQIAERCEGAHGLTDLKMSIAVELKTSIKRGTIQRIQKGNAGQRALYAQANGTPAPVAKPAAPLPAKPKPKPSSVAPTAMHATIELVEPPAPPIAVPQAMTTTVPELLPGPEPNIGGRFIEMLDYLKAQALGDVEAINRVLGMLERRAA